MYIYGNSNNVKMIQGFCALAFFLFVLGFQFYITTEIKFCESIM